MTRKVIVAPASALAQFAYRNNRELRLTPRGSVTFATHPSHVERLMGAEVAFYMVTSPRTIAVTVTQDRNWREMRAAVDAMVAAHPERYTVQEVSVP